MEKIDKFIASIDSDIAWRKKEVSNIILMHDDSNGELIVKSSVLLIYSHWEGCVKNLCKLYLGYVSNHSINITKLTDNYKAIVLKGKIKQVIESSESLTMSNELSFIKLLDSDSEKKFRFKQASIKSEKDKSVINTEGNLSYKVFTSLVRIIGINDRECIKTKQIFIDEKLLSNRNKIAHGNKIDKSDNGFDLNIETIKEIKGLIFLIIDSLAADIKFYAENQYYLSEKYSESQSYNETSNNELKFEIDKLNID